MKIEPTLIPDVKIIIPRIFEDSRGLFFECFQKEVFAKAGITKEFVQDNQSTTRCGTVRGLHFQVPPFAQGKLVRVVKGAVKDVAVDLRKQSVTYGKHVIIELNEENKLMMWIPEGFAHGFVALEDNTIFHYKCTQFYHQHAEDSLLWNDPDLNINWGINQAFLSEKDKTATSFKNFISPF